MKSALPKHLHPLLGRRLVDWVVEAVRPLEPDPLVVVLSPEAAGEVEGVSVAVQERPLGTGDSLRAARSTIGDAGTVLVVSGDHPRISSELLGRLVGEHRSAGATATVLSFRTDTIGVNACWLPSGMFVGVAFTLIGAVHVNPPSVDRVSAMLDRGPKVESCHTT